MAATLKCDIISNASSATANITLDTAGNATVAGTLAMGSSFLRNRIINGDMRIDQRNAGASVTISNTYPYTLDRWSAYSNTGTKFTVQQNAGSVTPPAGYTNYLGCTSTSAYTLGSGDQMLLTQRIEGYNVADLGWGTSNTKNVTLSFWVYSSLTGTFGGSIQNSDASWCYPFSYSISQAYTWEQKTVTITGPNASQGTWLKTNGSGLVVNYSLGTGTTYSGTAGSWVNTSYLTSVTGAVSVVGTNGATFYITGVQLEVGSVATPFERRQYGQELILASRYYQTTQTFIGVSTGPTVANGIASWPITMRASPTIGVSGVMVVSDVTASDYTQSSASITSYSVYTNTAFVGMGNFSGMTAGKTTLTRLTNANVITLSAEL